MPESGMRVSQSSLFSGLRGHHAMESAHSAHRLSALCRWGKSTVRKRAVASAALTLSFGRLAEAQSWPCLYVATEAFAHGATACSATSYAPQWCTWMGCTLSRVARLRAVNAPGKSAPYRDKVRCNSLIRVKSLKVVPF